MHNNAARNKAKQSELPTCSQLISHPFYPALTRHPVNRQHRKSKMNTNQVPRPEHPTPAKTSHLHHITTWHDVDDIRHTPSPLHYSQQAEPKEDSLWFPEPFPVPTVIDRPTVQPSCVPYWIGWRQTTAHNHCSPLSTHLKVAITATRQPTFSDVDTLGSGRGQHIIAILGVDIWP